MSGKKEMLTAEQLRDFVVQVLDEKKADDIEVIDVRGKSALTDFMIIASGTSTRHVSSLARTIQEALHKKKIYPLAVEGITEGEWILLDLNDVIVHLFKPEARGYYNLEELWREGEKNVAESRKNSPSKGL